MAKTKCPRCGYAESDGRTHDRATYFELCGKCSSQIRRELQDKRGAACSVTPQEAYVQGIEDGIRAYAWMRDGVTYVGTTGRTLAEALENARNGTYPPQRNMDAAR